MSCLFSTQPDLHTNTSSALCATRARANVLTAMLRDIHPHTTRQRPSSAGRRRCERLQIYSVYCMQCWVLCAVDTWGQCCTTIHHCLPFLLRLSSSAVFSSSVVLVEVTERTAVTCVTTRVCAPCVQHCCSCVRLWWEKVMRLFILLLIYTAVRCDCC